MKLGPSRRGSVVLPAMIALTVMAVVSFALAGQRIAHAPRQVPRHVNGTRHDAGEGRGSGSVSVSNGAHGGTSTDPSEACTAAMSDGVDAVEAAAGLTHAIDVLLTNCRRNDQAQGLVTALQRLQDAKEHRGTEHGHAGGPPTGAGGASDAHSNAHAGEEDRPPSPRGRGEGAPD